MDKIQQALKDRYQTIHPLLFHRSVEKSITNGELFDLLDGMPQEYPIIWDNKTRKWEYTSDLIQGTSAHKIKKENHV